MNKWDLFDAITELPEDRIREAEDTPIKQRSPFIKWAALAACVALVVGLIGWLYPFEPPTVSFWPEPNGETTTDTKPTENQEDLPDVEESDFDKGGTAGNAPSLQSIQQVNLPEEYDRYYLIPEELRTGEDFLLATNGFAYQTGAALLGQSTGNQNYSPLSLYYALALTATGSGGNTARQFCHLLGVDSTVELSQNCQNLFRVLYKNNEDVQLKPANSIWMSHDTPFYKQFVDNAATRFYAESFTVDFEDPATGKAMGQWVADNTGGLLSPTFQTDERDLMKILNTVYFKDEWQDGFQEKNTKKDTFHLASGQTVQADFMNQTEYTVFYRGDGFLRSQKYFKNGGSMFFILPDEGATPQELLASAEEMERVLTGGEEFYGKTTWKVPTFKISAKYEKLEETLMALGLTDAFGSKADFSQMTDRDAFIDSIVQETTISVDEKGVEAAAYTKVDLDKGGIPDENETAEMILDRPFLYGVQSNEGVLLFVGICENPVE